MLIFLPDNEPKTCLRNITLNFQQEINSLEDPTPEPTSAPTVDDKSDDITESTESTQLSSLDTNNMLYDPQNFDPATQGNFTISVSFEF